jgi:hypothetical protein
MLSQNKPSNSGMDHVDDIPTPSWNKLVALGVAVGLIVLLIVFHYRLKADFWPLDRSSIGPNLVASVLTWAAVFTASVLLYPPWRRRLHRFVDNKLLPVHAKLNQHRVSLQDLHRKHDELHAKHEQLLQSHQTLLDSHAEVHRKLDSLMQNGNES